MHVAAKHSGVVAFTIRQAQTTEALALVGGLIHQYAVWRGFDVAMGDIEREIKTLPGAFGPPGGVLLLALVNEETACGCAAFQRLDDMRCEMKRMFVPADWQGLGIGRALGDKLLQYAGEMGYEEMVLDTHPHMEAAHRLYDSLGFRPISRYNQNPTPGIRYMGRRLGI
ncbi:MAG: GNAT family N-acetyltransferase [Bacteroidota bacterium]